MSANGSYPGNPATNHDTAMEVDGGNQRSRKPSSPMMRSRFDHTNGGFSSSGRGQSGQRNSGDFTITAGIGSHSPGVRRRGTPGFSGASVTTVVNGHPESDETVGASIMIPQTSGSEDARIRPNYQSHPVGSDRDVVGVITIGEARDHAEGNTTGQQGQQQEQQQKHQEPVPNFGNHNPVRAPEVPVIPEPQRPQLHYPQQQQHQRPLPNFGNCMPHHVPEVPITPEPPRSLQFQILVKNLDGKNHTFQVEQTTLVEVLMEMIRKRLGMPLEQQVLQYAGRNLQKGHTLAYYNIQEGSTIFLTGRLRGG